MEVHYKETGENGQNTEVKPQRTDKKKKPLDWRWNRKSSADWTSYRARIEDEMNDFAMEMVVDISEEWTPKKRFERLKEYLTRAADQTRGRINVGKENGN